MIAKAQINRRLEQLAARFDPAVSDLESLVGDLQEAFDSKSERWQESDAGVAWQEYLTTLGEALEAAQTVLEAVNGALE